ncbi:MAG: hypothetical protein K2X25_07090 [Caulobacteraceae bacterium]|nr:hypothetical protein [Caulobacteraceae bacterium]
MKTLTLAPSALALTALAVASGLALTAPAASAQTAARVESQTRPNFGVLLDPPASQTRQRQHRRWTYGSHRPDWRPAPAHPYSPGGGEEIVLVDCGGNPGTGAVEDAVRRVRPGGTLVIRARGGACVGWLNVDKPMTILGEGGFDPRRWHETPPATLQAPDGLPCITVSAGVRLELRDVVLASPNAGEAACVVGYGAQIIMSRVGFRHAGDEAAIYADGGLIDLRDVMVDARTLSPAIVTDGATLTAWETEITGAQSGIELTPGEGQTSRLDRVRLSGIDSLNNFGPRAIGVLVRSRRSQGRVEITNSKICGYVEGVANEGSAVLIDQSSICKSDKGVVLYNGELTLTNSRIRADSFAVALASGRAVIADNSFIGVERVFLREYRASLESSGNRVWSDSGLCQPRFRSRYRDRYAPFWEQGSDEGWSCQYSPLPRQDWADMDGSYGAPYQEFVAWPERYDSFEDGYGWYDGRGRYIDAPGPIGDRRWTHRR